MGKILVTGGAGYIGSHTVVELLNAGYEVVIADNFSNSKPVVLDRIKMITGKDFGFYEIDVTDASALRRVFHEHKVDAVIHFAGLKAVGESVAIPLKYYKNNLMSTLVLCEIMQENQVKSLIFSSSATVYGLNNVSPLTEDLPLSATNPYGQTKVMLERILTDIHVSDPSFQFVFLRYFNPIGAHESGMIGEDPNGIPNNLMPFITQVASGKRETLGIFGDDYDTLDGTGVRDYIHVVDLAKGHVAALKVVDRAGIQIYNLGTGVGYSVFDVVHAFEKVTGITIPYKILDRRPGDIAVSYSDASKAYEAMAWKAEHSLEDMCASSWNWQKQNPNGYEE